MPAGRAKRVTGVDKSPDVSFCAREFAGDHPQLALGGGDFLTAELPGAKYGQARTARRTFLVVDLTEIQVITGRAVGDRQVRHQPFPAAQTRGRLRLSGSAGMRNGSLTERRLCDSLAPGIGVRRPASEERGGVGRWQA
ncbi:hypothetical protein GCM10010515_56330 [Streptomyces fructofermentans]|uniref:Uncharacterized protein n=1 Tax=Streptomyces fructofermentans TaxID=152141 RepID=A0A918NMP1_9ACTN|nr:hypothetical protein GCM10010515_56330 [Streptomyces fructofermentans]